MNGVSLPDFLASQPLLMLALLALGVSLSGAMLAKAMPRFGTAVKRIGSIGIVAVLVLTVLDVARMNPHFDFGRNLDLPQLGLPAQVVEGGETRIPMASDGHFWLVANVNGTDTRFLVDTGASLTAVSGAVAQDAGLEPIAGQNVRLQTANGMVTAHLTRVAEMRVGNIVARDLDAVVAPSMDRVNVIGMNFLSRLESWRVENGELVLVPAQPAATN